MRADHSHELPDLYITSELDERGRANIDTREQLEAVQELAELMLHQPDRILPEFVDLALHITGASSAGISVYEPAPPPGIFRWRFLRGHLAEFEGSITPRDFSPCGVALDEGAPVLSKRPERYYGWIRDAGIEVPEVLLTPINIKGSAPLGTLWVVSEGEGVFNRSHADAIQELSSFIGVALRMLEINGLLEDAVDEDAWLANLPDDNTWLH